MTADELLRQLRALDAELHSDRVTAHYRTQDAATRARFVGLRGWVGVAVADATHARLEELADALARNDAALREGFEDATRTLKALRDATRVLDVVANVLSVLSVAVPGIIDGAT